MKVAIGEMSIAVGDLVAPARRQLRELEELTYRQGIEPGPDLAFAGLRIVIARSEEAARFLAKLAPHQAELDAWLAAKMANRVEAAVTTASAV
ncbi:MAG: hypothetical protein ACREHV_01065 [Rhizomicrobium sp.]